MNLQEWRKTNPKEPINKYYAQFGGDWAKNDSDAISEQKPKLMESQTKKSLHPYPLLALGTAIVCLSTFFIPFAGIHLAEWVKNNPKDWKALLKAFPMVMELIPADSKLLELIPVEFSLHQLSPFAYQLSNTLVGNAYSFLKYLQKMLIGMELLLVCMIGAALLKQHLVRKIITVLFLSLAGAILVLFGQIDSSHFLIGGYLMMLGFAVLFIDLFRTTSN